MSRRRQGQSRSRVPGFFRFDTFTTNGPTELGRYEVTAQRQRRSDMRYVTVRFVHDAGERRSRGGSDRPDDVRRELDMGDAGRDDMPTVSRERLLRRGAGPGANVKENRACR